MDSDAAMKLCGLPIVVERDGARHVITIAMRTDGTSNAARREHWAARSKRVAAERVIVTTAMRRFRAELPANDNGLDGQARYLVRLVRLAPRLCDTDGAIHALKTVRDMVAAGLGTDDGPTGRCEWCYGQERAKVRAVRIELERVS